MKTPCLQGCPFKVSGIRGRKAKSLSRIRQPLSLIDFRYPGFPTVWLRLSFFSLFLRIFGAGYCLSSFAVL